MSVLNDAPFLLASARIGFPQAHPAEKCVLVATALDSIREPIESIHIAAPKHDVIGDEATLQLSDDEDNFAFPFRFAEPLNSRNAEKIFDDIAVAIRKIAELEWHKGFFPNKRGTEPGPETKKQHSPAPITSQGLHGGIIDYLHRFAERFAKIEPNPAGAKMFWVS